MHYYIFPAATKPFLRQIETLHSAHSTQTVNWEKVEANLTQRLGMLNGGAKKMARRTKKVVGKKRLRDVEIII